jgi:soluble cytochrome b562
MSHLAFADQLALLNLGTLDEVLKAAKDLVETQGEKFRLEMDSYDPKIHDRIFYEEPGYEWPAQDHSVQLDKVQAFLLAATTKLKAVNQEAKRLKDVVKSLKTYIQRLEDDQPPMWRVVPKKVQTRNS